jgi:hypothetical protein
MAQLAALKLMAASPTPGAQQPDSSLIETPVVERKPIPSETPPKHQDSAESHASGSLSAALPNSRDDPTSPSAILLRQRFSAQRQNYSTSSSGTNGTGCLNTCSSTD